MIDLFINSWKKSIDKMYCLLYWHFTKFLNWIKKTNVGWVTTKTSYIISYLNNYINSDERNNETLVIDQLKRLSRKLNGQVFSYNQHLESIYMEAFSTNSVVLISTYKLGERNIEFDKVKREFQIVTKFCCISAFCIHTKKRLRFIYATFLLRFSKINRFPKNIFLIYVALPFGIIFCVSFIRVYVSVSIILLFQSLKCDYVK